MFQQGDSVLCVDFDLLGVDPVALDCVEVCLADPEQVALVYIVIIQGDVSEHHPLRDLGFRWGLDNTIESRRVQLRLRFNLAEGLVFFLDLRRFERSHH